MNEYRDWDGFDFKPKKDILIYPDKLLEMIKPQSRILEIGCYEGNLSFELANAGHKVLGIDISKPAIENAKKEIIRREAKDISFKCADMCEKEEWDKIPTEKIDAVVLVKVMTVIPRSEQREALIENILSYLRPGAMIYIYDFKYNKDNPAYSKRYDEGYDIFRETGTFEVKDELENHMYYAHHHTQEEIDMLSDRFETLSLQYSETISYHGHRADTFEFVAKIKEETR